MAPIQTFSSSPITAAKAPAATAQPTPTTSRAAAPATAAAPASSAASLYGPPSAQPGSRPSYPSATSSASTPPRAAHHQQQQATPTQPLANNNNNPPAPQPGAAPTPPGASLLPASASHLPSRPAGAAGSSLLPRPPKKGETLGPAHTGVAAPPPPPTYGGGTYSFVPTTTTSMPAQMAYPPPATSMSIRGTSTTATTAATFPSPYASGPVPLPVGNALAAPGINRATDMSHPPGYQQDAHAAEFSSGQRAAHHAYVSQHQAAFGPGSFVGGGGEDGAGEDGIWGTAKKWVSAAGDTLVAAEGQVWKVVNNKDQT
ncbi:hypothetical protein A9K55_003876 [Cordyceps militaris]|uniref:Uncharacterized protein n=1 Tax=Cordyceps militaris TaxID=73501 RepID=A0A2H4SLF3_CORMI|nr:hypothetical protein A9K55_003876 [Cordyceps militaris]